MALEPIRALSDALQRPTLSLLNEQISVSGSWGRTGLVPLGCCANCIRTSLVITGSSKLTLEINDCNAAEVIILIQCNYKSCALHIECCRH